MYHLRGLSAAERRLFVRALRGTDDDLPADGDVPGPDDDESTDDPKGGDTTSSPGADPGGNPMRLVTANVKNNMTVANRRADFQKIAGLGSILLLQEIREGTSQDLLRQVFPESAWHILPRDEHRTDKLVIKKSLWTVEQSGSEYMSPKPPTYGRKRYVNWALVTLTGTSIQFLVMDTHYVAHAWCNHQIADKALRKTYWNRHYNRMQNLVLDARGKGITVVGGGDFNRGSGGLAKFHTSQDWFRQANLDHLFGVPASGGATYTVGATQSVSLNSDHNALVAQLAWSAGTNALRSGYNWPGM